MVLTSLITAVPGALVVFLVIMGFLQYGGGWSAVSVVLSSVLLLIGLGLFLMPVGIYVWTGKAEKKPKADAAQAAESGSGELVAEESGELVTEDSGEKHAVTDSSLEVVDETGDFAMTGELAAADESHEEFDLDAEPAAEEDAEELAFEEEPEEKPKKGKK